MIVPARRRLPRAINYRGMGALAPFVANPENCNPLDVGCVMRNVANNNAYNKAVVTDAAQTAYDQCLKNAANAGSQAQYDDTVTRCQAEYATMFSELGGADSRPESAPVASVPIASPYVQSAPAAPPTAAPSVVPAKTIVTSSGAQTAPASTPVTASTATSTSVLGFDISSIPWWGWLAAGGAAFFFMGGQRGR